MQTSGETYTQGMGSPLVFLTLAFIAGLLLGSFLNVCISRIPRGESIVKPRSHCLECNATIRWYDNIPLLSWMVLRGRCRDCGHSISWRYPAVELATGLWFLNAAHALQAYILSGQGEGSNANAILATITILITGFLLIGLCVMDWQTHRLPDAFTWSGICLGILLVCVQAAFLGPSDDQIHLRRASPINSAGAGPDRGDVFLTGPEAVLGGRLVAVVGAAALLLAIRWLYQRLRKREGMGLGDVKLLAMIAALLGFWPAMLSLFAGVLFGSIYGVFLMATKRADRLTRLPLGSFLAAGGLLVALFGDRFISWYRGLL